MSKKHKQKTTTPYHIKKQTKQQTGVRNKTQNTNDNKKYTPTQKEARKFFGIPQNRHTIIIYFIIYFTKSTITITKRKKKQ